MSTRLLTFTVYFIPAGYSEVEARDYRATNVDPDAFIAYTVACLMDSGHDVCEVVDRDTHRTLWTTSRWN